MTGSCYVIKYVDIKHKHKCIEKHNIKPEKVLVKNLVSDLTGVGNFTDPNLINSWGITIINNVIWVADNGTGKVTTYNLNGSIYPIVVSVNNNTGVALAPSGIVHNKTTGFVITNGTIRAPALWLVATENGLINAYNPLVNSTASLVVVDNSATGAVYKGITIVNGYLYATDFHNNKIDVFDSNFNPVTTFPFVDPSTINPLPAGFAPFNIRNIKGLLYVTYALQKPPANHDDQAGLGNGFINIFNPDGTFVERLVSQGALNSPWGIILAPESLNLADGTILVGNFGDGYINIYASDGTYLGRLKDCIDNDVNINGLWGLAINDPDEFYGRNAIYFTAGPNSKNDGLLGKLISKCNECCY